MWLSFWVTVGFGVIFVVVGALLRVEVPAAFGYVPAVVLSVAANGWEKFWHPTYGTREYCLPDHQTARGVCWDGTDYLEQTEPAGVSQVLLPWAGDQTFVQWLTTGVPLDLAATAVAAGLAWLALRPFGHHTKVEKVL